jgi:hypothetical protein
LKTRDTFVSMGKLTNVLVPMAATALAIACSSSSGSSVDGGSPDMGSDTASDMGTPDTGGQDTSSADTGAADAAVDGKAKDGGDASKADAMEAAKHKHVFVTSQSYQGQVDITGLGGVNDGDTQCNSAAQSAALGGTWVAWLSGTDDVGFPRNAVDRVMDVSPWYLMDNTTLVFATKTDIGFNPPQHAIDQDENGQPVGGFSTVWTGTLSDGSAATDTCTDAAMMKSWTSSAATVSGATGDASSMLDWTASLLSNPDTCDQMHRLYCFEQ